MQQVGWAGTAGRETPMAAAATMDAPVRPQRLGQPGEDLPTALTELGVILDVETDVAWEGIVTNLVGTLVRTGTAARCSACCRR